MVWIFWEYFEVIVWVDVFVGVFIFLLGELCYEYFLEVVQGESVIECFKCFVYEGFKWCYKYGVFERVWGMFEYEFVLIVKFDYEFYFLMVCDIVYFVCFCDILC